MFETSNPQAAAGCADSRSTANVYATRDHIVPSCATTALQQHLGGRDCTEIGVDTGHIGLYVPAAAGSTCQVARYSGLEQLLQAKLCSMPLILQLEQVQRFLPQGGSRRNHLTARSS